MTFTWKQLLAVVLLASAAFGAGALVTHNLGVTAAKTMADSAAKANYTRDSLVIALAGSKALSDSVAHADSILAAALLGKRALDSAAVGAAKDEAAAATTQLAATRTTADSVAAYRDQVVPALTREVSHLTTALARSDSATTANAHGWANEIRRSAQFTALLVQDSLVLHADSLALDRAAKVSVVAMSPLTKLESAAELGAIGAATVGACANKVLSIGCLAGAAVTIKRVLKP